MIFKVYYQDSLNEAPTRENTKTLFIKAETEREVRLLLQDKEYNIEHIKQLTEEHLAYEQEYEDFKVLES